MSEKGKSGMSMEDHKRHTLRHSLDERRETAEDPPRSLDEDEEADPDHARLWMEEIQRRHREYKEGKARVFDAEEVVAELRAKFA